MEHVTVLSVSHVMNAPHRSSAPVIDADPPHFPPAFRPVAIAYGDAADIACARAAAGGEAGTLVWHRRLDRLDAAVVLEPDRTAAATRFATTVAAKALADALGALAPPATRVAVNRDGSVSVNGATVGDVRLRLPDSVADGDVPPWAVLAVHVDVLGDPADDSPGLDPHRTSLRDEGFDDALSATLLESFARHLLYWMDSWLTDGEGAVRP